ncbi:MAG: DUF739 family protein [Solobacterium sp.]|nr:DUF739 family protein [Solobacterium sp.]
MSDKPEFNYSKLRGKIVEKYGTIKAVSEKTGIRGELFTDAFKGRRTFTQAEIYVLSEALEIPKEDLASYFFET